ncbi:hypothetical protein ACX93W_13810 [Paenibacillus sp. CAU 1782]
MTAQLKKRMMVWLALPLLVMGIWSGYMPAATAAPFVFSSSAQKAFDSMAQSAAPAKGGELRQRYAELQSRQREEVELDVVISKLHYRNEERDQALRKAIREIDSGKIASLETEAAKAKKKYEPLFSLYETQKKQLSMAKAAKNKTLTSYYQIQTDISKAAVQIAKQDIANKTAAHKKAKADASAKMKLLRDMLFPNKARSSGIKAAKSEASAAKKLLTAELKTLNQAVKKEDVQATLTSLNKALTHQKKINARKTAIQGLENTISETLGKAEAKLKTL